MGKQHYPCSSLVELVDDGVCMGKSLADPLNIITENYKKIYDPRMLHLVIHT